MMMIRRNCARRLSKRFSSSYQCCAAPRGTETLSELVIDCKTRNRSNFERFPSIASGLKGTAGKRVL